MLTPIKEKLQIRIINSPKGQRTLVAIDGKAIATGLNHAIELLVNGNTVNIDNTGEEPKTMVRLL